MLLDDSECVFQVHLLLVLLGKENEKRWFVGLVAIEVSLLENNDFRMSRCWLLEARDCRGSRKCLHWTPEVKMHQQGGVEFRVSRERYCATFFDRNGETATQVEVRRSMHHGRISSSTVVFFGMGSESVHSP